MEIRCDETPFIVPYFLSAIGKGPVHGTGPFILFIVRIICCKHVRPIMKFHTVD